MIKELTPQDSDTIYGIINEAAEAYRGAIPNDCFHEPYMPIDELLREMDNMTFFGWEENGSLVGVMGFQPVQDVTLIRHAYVLSDHQRKGIGENLVNHLKLITKTRQLLVGTWEDATWAIDFYQKQGFKLLPNSSELLMKYWIISQRQVETSVVLGMEM